MTSHEFRGYIVNKHWKKSRWAIHQLNTPYILLNAENSDYHVPAPIFWLPIKFWWLKHFYLLKNWKKYPLYKLFQNIGAVMKTLTLFLWNTVQFESCRFSAHRDNVWFVRPYIAILNIFLIFAQYYVWWWPPSRRTLRTKLQITLRDIWEFWRDYFWAFYYLRK